MHATIIDPARRAPQAHLFQQDDHRTTPFVHPGASQAPRLVEATSVHTTEEFRVFIPAGDSVGAALLRLIEQRGGKAGCGRIVGGMFDRVQYHVITRASEGIKPFVYGAPIVVTGASALISAAITVGHKGDGAPILHCHGGFIDAEGHAHGGHLILDRCIAGSEGLVVRLSLFEDVDFVLKPDIETAYDLLIPVRKS